MAEKVNNRLIEHAQLTPSQRILQHQKKRISIRLEKEFWDQLEVCASEDSIKVSKLVFNILAMSDEKSNRSSLLRVFCVRWLQNKLNRWTSSPANIDLAALVSACPTPCFVMTPDRKISFRNAAFDNHVLSALIAPDQWDETDTRIRLVLSRPFDQIARSLILSDADFATANVALTRDSAIIQMQGRFCLIDRSHLEGSPLLCFLLEQQSETRRFRRPAI